MHPLSPGTQIGAWRVASFQGQGAYGAVYRAVNVGREQPEPVAIKIPGVVPGAGAAGSHAPSLSVRMSAEECAENGSVLFKGKCYAPLASPKQPQATLSPPQAR